MRKASDILGDGLSVQESNQSKVAVDIDNYDIDR